MSPRPVPQPRPRPLQHRRQPDNSARMRADAARSLRRRLAEQLRASALLAAALLSPLWAAGSALAESTIELEQVIEAGDDRVGYFADLARAADDAVYIADSDRGGLVIFAEGIFSRRPPPHSFSPGRSDGVAHLGNGRVALVDSDDNRVLLLDEAGRERLRFAAGGDRDGQLDRPRNIAHGPSGRLYIADHGNARIAIYSRDGVFLRNLQLPPHDDGSAASPDLVKLDPAENLYVLERARGGRISIFDADGRLQARFDAKLLAALLGRPVNARAMAVDASGVLYIGDSKRGRIYQFDWRQRRLLNAFGSRGQGRGRFANLTALLSLGDDRLLVADSGNHKLEIYRLPAHGQEALKPRPRSGIPAASELALGCAAIHRYSASQLMCARRGAAVLDLQVGTDLRRSLGAPTAAPRAVQVDGEGVLLLDGNRLLSLDHDGGVQFSVGEAGAAAGQFDAPQDLSVRGNRIYIADTGNRRIQIFSRDGVALEVLELDAEDRPLFDEPVAVHAAADGQLLVADRGHRRIAVFSAEHELIAQITHIGDQPIRDLFDLDMDADGQLYALAATEHNDALVAVFSGTRLRFRFAAAGDTGYAIGEPAGLSVSGEQHVEISVLDADRQRLLRYEFAQRPARISAPRVIGDERTTRFIWRPADSATVTGYRIYTAAQRRGPYQLREALPVGSDQWSLEHQGLDAPLYYQVSAVSADGLEGPRSIPARDVFRIAYEAYAAGDYRQAARHFREAVRIDPAQGSARRYLGLSLMHAGEAEAADQAFAELGELPGESGLSLNLRIRALAEAGRELQAKALIDRALADGTANVETLRICGDLSLGLDDAISAVNCLEEGVTQAPDNVELQLLLGRAYLDLGIERQGFEALDRATALAGEDAQPWYRVARIHAGRGRLQQAAARLEKALSLEPEYRDAQLALARLYLELGQYSKVNNLAIKLAGDGQTAAEGHYLMGVAAAQREDWPRALVSLTRATNSQPDKLEAWLALADAQSALGRADKALAALRRAVIAAPRDYQANLRLGEHLLASGQLAAAIAPLRDAVNLRPDSAEVRLLLADALEHSDHGSEALRHAAMASRLSPTDNRPRVQMARLYLEQGKHAAALREIDQALERSPAEAALYTLKGRILAASALYQRAGDTLQKAVALAPREAEPRIELAALFRQRRLFDEAIATLEALVEQQPDAYHQALLEEALAERKRAHTFARDAAQLVLRDLRFEPVFSATHQQYAEQPLGRVTVANISGEDYDHLRVSFHIRGYMDFPSTLQIEHLAAGESRQVDLHATFNQRVLDIEEDTGVQAEIALLYHRDGREQRRAVSRTLTLYGKNAVLWGRPEMVGAFVTPRDPLLRDFVRRAVRDESEPGIINPRLLRAMMAYESLSALGLRYSEDPTSPYSTVSTDRVDSVQFPRETLRLRVGDCDDLSVLYSAALAQLGMDSAFVHLPGHLLLMFDTGLGAAQAETISVDPDLLVIHADKVWVPVETTLVGAPFVEAWAEGARRYREAQAAGSVSLVTLESAWQEFPPVSFKQSAADVPVPAASLLEHRYERSRQQLREHAVAHLVRPYEAVVARDPGNREARMQIAIHYARNGMLRRADSLFDQLLRDAPDDAQVHNNRGSMYFTAGDFESALDAYHRAERLAADDAQIKINIAMAHYRLGNPSLAREKFEEAAVLSDTVSYENSQLARLLGL